MWIVRLALNRPYTFVVLALLLFLMAPVMLLRTPVDIFPEINIPVVSIIWTYTGLVPQELERRITSIYERALTTTVGDVEHIESQSLNGVAVIKVYLQPQANVEGAIAEVDAEAQATMKQLPQGIIPPLVIRYSASTVPILQLGLSGKGLSEQQLNDMGTNFIRPQLATIPGAAVPLPYGGTVRQIMVDIDSARLKSEGLSPLDVVNAVNAQNVILPSGTAKIGKTEFNVGLNGNPGHGPAIEQPSGENHERRPIFLHDVAHVRDGYAVQQNIVRQDGQRGALLTVEKAGNASTLAIVSGIRAALPAIAATLPPELVIRPLSDQSIFVKASLNGVAKLLAQSEEWRIQLPLFASYEIDAWGRIRRSVQSARATQEATVADLRFVCLSVEASVAIDYYQLRETDEELEILDGTITDFTRALTLTTDRFKKGLNSELEVEQAKTLLDQTTTQKQALQIQRAQLKHALAVLLGRTVEGFSLPDQPSSPTPPAIPTGLPSDLLERRPDIAEADRNVAAATAHIGVAKAAYFPQLSLTGLVGYESSNAVSLLNWQNTIASLGASAVAPIFTGGRLRAGVDQAQAVYRQSLAKYEKTVLVAYQEVEDQLAALQYLAGESQSEASAVHDATRAEEIAMQRYKAGLVGYLDVVYAQEIELSNERTAAQISGERLVASVVLIKALGGGWTGGNTP